MQFFVHPHPIRIPYTLRRILVMPMMRYFQRQFDFLFRSDRLNVEHSLAAVVYTLVGAAFPIIFSAIILAIGGKDVNLHEFARSGDFFIIANGLILPATFQLARKESMSAHTRSNYTLYGIGTVALASLAFGAVKLVNAINATPTHLPHPAVSIQDSVVWNLAICLIVLSVMFSILLQLHDDTRDSTEAQIDRVREQIQEGKTAYERNLFSSFQRVVEAENRDDAGRGGE